MKKENRCALWATSPMPVIGEINAYGIALERRLHPFPNFYRFDSDGRLRREAIKEAILLRTVVYSGYTVGVLAAYTLESALSNLF